MLKKSILIASVLTLLLADNTSDFAQQQMQGFNEYKKSQEDAFAAYQEEQMKAFEDYKKEIGAFWEEPKLSTKKEWIGYTKDKKTRTDVDFEKQTITVETIAASEKEAKQKLQLALAKAVTIDTKTVQETDPLEQKLAKIKQPQNVVDSKVRADPILSTVIFNQPPTKENVKNYVYDNITDNAIKSQKSTKVPHASIYSVVVQLPKDTMLKRSKVYLNDVQKHAKKQDIPTSLIFAIMHSESSFNPRARSYVPAYGLMQLVPKTAGRDTYKYLYNEDKLVSSSYLYDSSNNITMGSAYLHILYYNYLKEIKNPDSKIYCTIAAYNTGAGNVACAFNSKKKKNGTTVCSSRNGDYNMNSAAPIINSLSPQEVYNRLLKDLKFDEPKHYLKNVSKRMSAYYKVYG